MKKDFPEIAVVMYNNLPERCKEISENLCDLTRFKFNGQYQFSIYETDNITDTLKTLIGQHQWAVVIAAGNTLQTQMLIVDMVNHARQEQSPLSCHILDRGGYYHLHPQCFTIDLDVYQEIGCPAFEKTEGPVELATLYTTRSEDSVHDDYTPWWLHTSQESHTYTSDQGYFGVQVIAKMISAGHNITNIPMEIRQRKNYCYPEYNLDEIKKIINDTEYLPVNDGGPVWWFSYEMRNMVQGLSRGYYVLNTEPLYFDQRVSKRQFDCFVGVASGVKPACLIGQLDFADNSQVILADISPAALKWQQYLFDSWDGDFYKLEQLLNTFKQHNPDLIPIYYQRQTFQELIAWFFSHVNMEPYEFQRCWKKYTSMDVKFVNLNFLESTGVDFVVDTINQHRQGAYVWTSNLFHMDYLSFYHTNRWAEQRLDAFKQALNTRCQPPVVLENGCWFDFFR
jgi:hypothetical protein